MPSLKTLFNIANYLKVSINYLFELTDINNFVEYDIKNIPFYNNLNMFIKSKNISNRKFCKDLNFSRDNIIRYKKGVLPNLGTLIQISNYFSCTIDELLL